MLAKLVTFLLRPSSKYSVLFLLLLGVVAAIAVLGGSVAMLEATGSNRFCLGCHEMQTAYDEYTQSVHYSNRLGISVDCVDCHLPHEYPEKLFAKMSRIMEVWYHLQGVIDTPDKYEANRLRMAGIIWDEFRSDDSRQCRGCHNMDMMARGEQTGHAVRAHERAGKAGKTCIDCHWGTAHMIPDMPLPEAARPRATGQPVQCTGCHESARTVLPQTHPETGAMSLAVCLGCHVPGNQDPDARDNFYTFMHHSHANRVDCSGCHEADKGSGIGPLLGTS